MKKISILISLLAIIAILLAACSPDSTPPGTTGGNTADGGSPDGDTGGSDEGSADEGGDNGDAGGTPVCDHADVNLDESCDICGESVVIIIDFYALNDLHGKFDDTDSSVGVDELTTYLRHAYETDDAVVILSSGDMWQGSSESNLTKGMIVTEWMNELDFVSMTVGNHEYDWGAEYIEANAALAEFPILAINIIDKSTGERVDYCQSSVMVERDGVKIGIIGAIGDCKSSISGSLVTDVDFKVGSALTALVKAESEKLRAEGAEFIVYSLHDGYEKSSYSTQQPSSLEMRPYYDTALSEGYVDLVFEGHSHMRYVHIDEEGVYHLQNGGYDNGISHVEVKLNFAADDFTVTKAEIVENNQYAHLSDDPAVDELLEKYSEQIAAATRVVGKLESPIHSNDLKQLVADLYIARGLEEWGESYDIVLGGGFISARDPGMLPSGKIIYSDLMSVLPFDNRISLCTIKGEQLLTQFINSSNKNYFISYSPYGDLIKGSIDPNATYYIISDQYSVDYKYNKLTVVDSLAPDFFARDLVAEYLEKNFPAGDEPDDTPPEVTPPEGETPDPGYKLTSIPDIYALASALGVNKDSAVTYCVKGRIVGMHSEKYGNVTIADENGNTLYIYGIKSETGGLFETIANKPKVGDTVVLEGIIQLYRKDEDSAPITEMKNAIILSIISAEGEETETPDPGYKLTSIPDIYALASALGVNKDSAVTYCVKGRIVGMHSEKYGNVTIEDENGNTLYVYGIKSETGGLFETIANKPKVGDTVVLEGIIQLYRKDEDSTPITEMKNAVILEIIPGEDAEDATENTAYEEE